MLKDIILSKIFINDKDAQGNELRNKKGQPFKMVNIEDGDGKKASMYIGQFNGAWDKKLDVISKWKVGDKVRVSLEQNGQWVNFSLPTKTEELEERVAKIENFLKAKFAHATTSQPQTIQRATPTIKTPVKAEFGQEMPPDEAFDPSEAPTSQEIPF